MKALRWQDTRRQVRELNPGWDRVGDWTVQVA